MKKRFVAKRRHNKTLFLAFGLILFSVFVNNKVLNNISASYLTNESGLADILHIKLDHRKLLLKLGFNYEDKKYNVKKGNNENDVPAFNEVELKNPTIYIYNSHQAEEYMDGNVLEAAKHLKEILKKNNIDVIVEETNITKIIKDKKLAYKDSYKITRDLLSKKINDAITLYIDLHRDSSKKEVTTATINNKSYAKMMFVIGAKHNTYKSNYKVANDLNKLIKNYSNELTRGIYVRKSSSYNQDLASNVLLLEMGGPYNTMEEVKNTLNVLADVLAYYIGE